MKDPKSESMATRLFAAKPQLRNEVTASPLFQKMKRERKKLTVDDEEYFVVEGDTLLDEDQLAFYSAQREKAATCSTT